MPGETVVILGGGVGGVVTAQALRKRLGKEHRIILVEKEDMHVFWPSLLWLQVGLRRPSSIVKDLRRLEKKGIEVVHGEAIHIDPALRSIEVAGFGQIQGDHLVVALGAALAPERVPGLAEAGHNLFSLEGATAIRDARLRIAMGRVVVLTAGVPYKCPAAPYEAAMLLDHDLRKRKLRDRVEVAVYAWEPAPMGVAGPNVSAGVIELLRERGIDYFPQHQVERADPVAHTLQFKNGVRAGFDLLAYVPPHVPPLVIEKSGLAGQTGWVGVDPHTLETEFPNVYAIGDVTTIPLSVGMPLPTAGVFAHGHGEAVARSISAKILGEGQPGRYNGEGACFVEVGGGKAAYGSGNFHAQPSPSIRLKKPSRARHAGKVMFEKNWLWRRV